VLWIGIVLIRIGSRDPSFHFDADPGLVPDWNENNADPHSVLSPYIVLHMLENRGNNFILFRASQLTVLLSHLGQMCHVFKCFGQIYINQNKKIHALRIDTDPDLPYPDWHALDADPDPVPDPAKMMRIRTVPDPDAQHWCIHIAFNVTTVQEEFNDLSIYRILFYVRSLNFTFF
jgi:hypothetical protein